MFYAKDEKPVDIESILESQCVALPMPPAGLLEQRVLELERLGLQDEEELPGMPSSARQFALVTLQRQKPYFFVTIDDQMLERRDTLEGRYGLKILSVYEAMLLLRDSGPAN